MKDTSSVFDELSSLAEEDYKKFNSNIVNTKQKVLGVRMPLLKKIAQRISLTDAHAFISLDKQNKYEMILLEGLVLSYMKESFIELVPAMERFLNKADSWAQIDSTILSFKKT